MTARVHHELRTLGAATEAADDVGAVVEPFHSFAVRRRAGPALLEWCLGECTVRRGDTVVADRDGMAMIPADRADQAFAAARARAVTEASAFAAIADGMTTLELLALDG